MVKHSFKDVLKNTEKSQLSDRFWPKTGKSHHHLSPSITKPSPLKEQYIKLLHQKVMV